MTADTKDDSQPVGLAPVNGSEISGEQCQCPNCGWHGSDMNLPRVCEIDAHDEPEGDEHNQYCAECDCEVWWLPKCPQCGSGCNWLYGREPDSQNDECTNPEGCE